MTMIRSAPLAPAAIAMIITVLELVDGGLGIVLLLLVKPVATIEDEMRLKLLELAEFMLLLMVL